MMEFAYLSLITVGTVGLFLVFITGMFLLAVGQQFLDWLFR